MGLLLQPRYYSDLSHPSQPPSLGTLLFFMLENVPGILTPVEKNSSVRFVDERFRLQGLTPGLAQSLKPTHATVVSGNAFPPPLVAAVCLPLLRPIRESRIDIHKRLSETDIECLIPDKRLLRRRYS